MQELEHRQVKSDLTAGLNQSDRLAGCVLSRPQRVNFEEGVEERMEQMAGRHAQVNRKSRAFPPTR